MFYFPSGNFYFKNLLTDILEHLLFKNLVNVFPAASIEVSLTNRFHVCGCTH